MKSSANSQLSFEIVQFTGQEKDYPMDEIKKSQQKSKGWQSQRFCEYPQEVIVKLTELSQIK
jgi:centrosomal protein CEP104